MPVTLSGPALAVHTAARRLAPLGARPVEESGGGSRARTVLDWADAPTGLHADLTWYGPAGHGPGGLGGRRGSEAAVQALSGLMQVHGRDAGRPRRIGLEVASIAAGVLAGQALLAAMIGQRRGVTVSGVQTSVLQAGLLLASHRIAAATCAAEWVPAPAGPAPGPPFRSAEGRLFEIETLDPAAWKAFWERLGAGGADLDWAWRLFRPRYFRGTCTLPPGLHEATAAHGFPELAAAARECAVSLCPVRSYDDVLDEPGWCEGHPSARPLAAATAHGAVPAGDGGGAGRWGAGRGGAAGGVGGVGGDGAAPLAGLRVVEATNRLQGPLAGLLLQMLGAEVTRVEPPGGDLVRTVPPLAGDTGSFFLTFNRGKQPVELDLGRGAGRAELVELVAGADVFLHNWRPGKAAEWRLEAGDLAAVNPRLVYAEASGWGDLPGVSHLVGTDFLVQAYAGVAAGITPHGQPPTPSRALLTDYAGALVTCEAVLSGLYRRERTGDGQRVGASLLAGAMSLQAHVLEALAGGCEHGRRGGRPLWGLLDHPLPTADGFVVVGVDGAGDVRRLCAACGIDPAACGSEGVEPAVAGRIAEAPTAHWEERLAAAAIPCAAACTDLADLPDDPRLAGLFESVGAGARVPAAPWRLS